MSDEIGKPLSEVERQFKQYTNKIKSIGKKLNEELKIPVFLNQSPQTRDTPTAWMEFATMRLRNKQYLPIDFELYISIPLDQAQEAVEIQDELSKADYGHFKLYLLCLKASHAIKDFQSPVFEDPDIQFVLNTNDSTFDCIIKVKEEIK